MKRFKRRAGRRQAAADLDVTPFMNLMIVLVPVLLLSMVFTHTTVIELNFPSGESADAAFDPEAVHLEVQVRAASLVVADGRGGKIKELPVIDGEPNQHNYVELTLVLQELKRRMPEKQDISILLEEETDYQTVVRVMDRVRSYPTVQGLDVVQAELFPVISLGDTPRADVTSSVPTDVMDLTGAVAAQGGGTSG